MGARPALRLLGALALLGPARGQDAGVAVRSATWSAESGDDNRDGGPMDDVFATCNGGDQYVRYRTGGSNSFTTLLTLAQPSDVGAVSVLVRQSPDTAGEGFSGIEIEVSTGGAFTKVYERHEMFGTFERAATHEAIAADFVTGVPTVFSFDSAVSAATQVRITMFYADIAGDASISFNSLAVFPPGAVQAVPLPPPPPPTAQSGLWVASASWTADDGADNRDGGPMNNVFSACNGGDQCKLRIPSRIACARVSLM